MVPEVGLEPTWYKPNDFESFMSTNFITRANKFMLYINMTSGKIVISHITMCLQRQLTELIIKNSFNKSNTKFK